MTINIDTGEVTGQMSRRALRMLEEWRQTHKNELLEGWHLAETDINRAHCHPITRENPVFFR